MAVTVDKLKNEIKQYNYQTLTGGDDDIASRAIEKAELWAKAKIIIVSGTWNPDSSINEEIVMKRALYELYAYGENEAVAADKREDALELLKAAYGSAIDASGYNQSGGGSSQDNTPGGAITKGKRNTSLF